ncbi:unnamed protein product [Enterobius vermicularis]|uniref:Bromo domain-containing protein n=1 Tax=Enterobius vermicularis TaxID=51028 RepID=A0A158QA58_ENTVE|nr:unnamed protein product [Enterobius vermicularis]
MTVIPSDFLILHVTPFPSAQKEVGRCKLVKVRFPVSKEVRGKEAFQKGLLLIFLSSDHFLVLYSLSFYQAQLGNEAIFTEIFRRMDLTTLKRNVESGEVRDLAEFKRRLLLMFANAVMFNSTGHDVNIYAKEMAKDTLDSLKVYFKRMLAYFVGLKELPEEKGNVDTNAHKVCSLKKNISKLK